MITGYGHFVQLAESLQWDETTIDLTTDIESWTKLEDSEYDQILGLLAGFCVGETSVALHLGSFQSKATVDDAMAGCFESQARDEARHARFFDRVVGEVVGIPGKNINERARGPARAGEPGAPRAVRGAPAGHRPRPRRLRRGADHRGRALPHDPRGRGPHGRAARAARRPREAVGPHAGHAQGHGAGAARRALAHRFRLPGHPERRPRRQRPRENPQRGRRRRRGPGETSSPPRTSRRWTSSTSAVSSPSGSSSGDPETTAAATRSR